MYMIHLEITIDHQAIKNDNVLVIDTLFSHAFQFYFVEPRA